MFKDRKYKQLFLQIKKLADLDGAIKIKFAVTFDEFIEAMRLIHRVYTKKRLISGDKKQPYFSPHLILPNNRLIIVTKNDCIIGTISLIEDSPIGVPMDNVHPDETSALRQQGNKFAEIGSFAIASEYQHHGITLLLYHAVFLYACMQKNIESILIAVHPRVAGVYKELFQFEPIGMVREYSTLNNAKSIPLKINTKSAISEIKKNNIFSECNNDECIDHFLHQYDEITPFYDAEKKKNDFNYLPVWQELHIIKYFNECSVNIKNLPEKQRVIIGWLYPALN